MFEDKVALITGSARGIGRATAELLAAGGAKVLVADLDRDAAEEAASQLGGDSRSWAGDLAQESAADDLVAATIDAFGRLDIVINNAGYTVDGPAHKMSDAQFREMLEIHTVVPFRVLRAAAPYLRDPAKSEREAGREVFRKVVNISSMSAYGNAGQANYSSAKSGLIGLTKTLAKEWGALKINVNAVAFGFIDTRLTAPKSADTTIEVGGRTLQVGVPEQMRAMLPNLVPLGRSGTPQEAAGGVAFLCSPWSDYVTGQVLNVGGGVPMGMSA